MTTNTYICTVEAILDGIAYLSLQASDGSEYEGNKLVSEFGFEIAIGDELLCTSTDGLINFEKLMPKKITAEESEAIYDDILSRLLSAKDEQ